MAEQWKPVVGIEDFYEVSSEGRIRSTAKRKNSFIGKILSPRLRPNGYYQHRLTDADGKSRTFKRSRLVAMAFIPNPENKPTVNHKNGVKSDDRVENLEWATMAENTIHAYRNHLANAARGEKHGHVKLSEANVHEIRLLLSSGHTCTSIGRIFGVNEMTVSDIKQKRTWGWLI